MKRGCLGRLKCVLGRKEEGGGGAGAEGGKGRGRGRRRRLGREVRGGR